VKRSIDAFVLNALHFLLVCGMFYFPLNMLDGDRDSLDGIGFVIVWMVFYYQSFRKPDYYEKRMTSTLQDTVKSYRWVLPIVILALGVLGAWRGWAIFRIGLAVLATSTVGVLLFDVLERAYIRNVVNRRTNEPTVQEKDVPSE